MKQLRQLNLPSQDWRNIAQLVRCQIYDQEVVNLSLKSGMAYVLEQGTESPLVSTGSNKDNVPT